MPALTQSLSSGMSAQRLEGSEAVLVAIAEFSAVASGTTFQSAPWLTALFATLALYHRADVFAVALRSGSGDLIFLLPLVRVREGGLRVLRSPSFGVSDYGGPLLGPAAGATGDTGPELWSALKSALPPADLLVLDTMPCAIADQKNPIATLAGAVPSHHHRNVVTVTGSVEDLLRSRGKKYRKEAERCARLLAERGPPRFLRCETSEEIAHAYAVLDEQQAARHRECGSTYVLNRPEYAGFYERLVRDGTTSQTAHLFTLGAGGETGAVLLGTTHNGVFTLLRISTAGGEWKRLSPGRLIVLEAMRYFVDRGVRTFDMGIGDYAFKHGFGTEPQPLVKLTRALSVRGWPLSALSRAKAAARRSEAVMRLARRLRPA